MKEKNGGGEYAPARPMWFDPPCDDPIKPVNLGQGYCSGEWLTNVTTYDYLVVPQVILPPLRLGRRTKGRDLGSWSPCRLFLGPGFRLGARWNRLGETVKTRKKREKTGKKWARYGLTSVNKESRTIIAGIWAAFFSRRVV